jgi:hypothetical protein
LNFTHVFQNIYVVVYRGPGYDGWLKTVSISDEGEIFYVDEFEYNTTNSYYPDIIHIYSDESFHYFAIAFRDQDGDGRIKTVKIDNNGDITKAKIDEFEFDVNDCSYPDIIHVNENTYAIVYSGSPSYDGYIVTVNITNTGTIIKEVISSQVFDTYCVDPKIIQVNGNIFAIVYRSSDGTSYIGKIKTGNISDVGIIADNTLDNMIFDSMRCEHPNIIHIGGRVFAVVYRGNTADGWLKSFRIGNNGNISDTIDEGEYFDTYCLNPEIIHVNGDTYAIVYGGVYGHYYYDMYLKTVEIKLEETTRYVVVKEGAYSLRANATKVFATISNDGGGLQELNVTILEGWNHIVLTYNLSSGMRLYRNATEEASGAHIGDIAQSTNDLIIGGYNCILDEVIIYSKALKQSDIDKRFCCPY